MPTTARAIELQHVNVKLLLAPGKIELDRLIPVFHDWIQKQVFNDMLLDVADYQHVPSGPGILVIGHHADYSVDNTDGRLGVRYNRKTAVPGSNQDRLRQATRAALAACRKLEQEPRLDDTLRFGGNEIQVFVNDRLLAPNTRETHEALEPELQSFAKALFSAEKYSVRHDFADPRRLYQVTIQTDRAFAAGDLLENIRV